MCYNLKLFFRSITSSTEWRSSYQGQTLGAAAIVTMFNPCGVIAKGFFAHGAVTSSAALIGNPGDAMAGCNAMDLVGGVLV
jgi:hypothetical protein